jgi:hypothetical protein
MQKQIEALAAVVAESERTATSKVHRKWSAIPKVAPAKQQFLISRHVSPRGGFFTSTPLTTP